MIHFMSLDKIDIKNIQGAKTFLRGVRFHGKFIDRVFINGGDFKLIESLDDNDTLRLAKDIYDQYFDGIDGQCDYVDIVFWNQNQ